MTLTEAVPDNKTRLAHLQRLVGNMADVLTCIARDFDLNQHNTTHLDAVEAAVTTYLDVAGYKASDVFAAIAERAKA